MRAPISGMSIAALKASKIRADIKDIPSNAIRFTPHGAIVTLSIPIERDGKPVIEGEVTANMIRAAFILADLARDWAPGYFTSEKPQKATD